MKSHLTENGVLSLYGNQGLQAKVQVLFLTYVNKFAFIRVTDFKHISPIMIIMKVMDSFVVGDVLLIKKVQLQSSGFLKEKDYQPFLDADVSHLLILEYQVVTSRKNGELFYQKNINDPENYYLNSLLLVKNYLVKAEGVADTYFNQLEKRVSLLKPDCNLLRERGNELYKDQKYVKALLHYEMAKQKDHFDTRVFNNCSQVHFCNNDYDKARIEALIALKLDPFNRKGYYRASQAMEKEGDFKGAAEVAEAGLFMCGPSEDLEKILLNSRAVCQQELSKSNKKKVSNGDTCDVINDFSSVHISSTNSKKVPLVKPKDSPIRKNKENEILKIDGKSDYNDIPLSSIISIETSSSILSFLQGARMLYEKGKYNDAIEVYVTTTSKANSNLLSKQDRIVVKYIVETCRILIGNELEEAKSSLLNFLDSFPYPPAIHYWLARINEILENQEKMIHHANTCILLTENFQYNLFWPGTKDLIQETMPDVLKKWFCEGTWRPAPFAKCRHVDCISIQGHNLAKTEIYLSDLDFRGYVEVECEEMCSICYHPCCWKAIKEHNEDGQLGKKIDKDFLGMHCFTPDCCGLICGIRIFDENSHLRNEIIKDKKEKKNSTISKPKKKKDKKKGSNQSCSKFDEKKKIKATESEEIKIENGIEVCIEETAINKKPENNVTVSFQSDPINFDSAEFKILRPNEEEEEDFQVQTNKKYKNKSKKKKKGKPTQINILAEEAEDKVVHNDYLNRLKALKSQQEALESDSVQLPSLANSTSRLKFLPDCVLDPEKPFYLPRHLQDNPSQLEKFLRSKMVTSSSADIEAGSINTLLEFVYDWLKASNPMNVNDPLVREYISENFPANAVAYVNKCGGVKNFLLQSFRFAIIDDIICVSEQVLVAQELAIQNCLEKFKYSKFLISDGHKATKMSHLLDESKSSCSTISSQSNNIFNSESNSGVSKPDYSTSATPYKAAAMANVPPHAMHTVSKDADKTSDLISKLIRPKPQPPQSGATAKKSTPKKPTLKTMNIDAFEVIESGEMGQLFSPQKPLHSLNEKELAKSSTVKGEMLFHSDEEMEDDMLSLRNKGSVLKSKQPSVFEMKETINFLEAELSTLKEELAKAAEEKELLSTQNQELNDRLSQIKMKSNVEISTLKKARDDAKEFTKIAETNFESYKNQKEGEIRKLLTDKSKHHEEIKAFSLKIDSLQLTIDQLSTSRNHYEEEAKQRSIQLAEQQVRFASYEEVLKRHSERIKDAECKYLNMKKELMTLHLDKTRKRLTAEINKMRELLSEANEETYPTKSSIIKAISEWDENIHKLHTSIQSISDDGIRYLDCIRSGRLLNSLPPGDLQLPTIPDLSVAKFLFVGTPISPKVNEKLLGPSLSNSAMGLMNNPFSNLPSSNMRSQGGIGGTFSFGQLGIGATPREHEGSISSLSHTLDPMQSSRHKDISLGMRSAFGSLDDASSRLKESSLGLGINSRVTEGLGLGSIGISGNRINSDRILVSGLSSRLNDMSSHLGENPLGIVGSNRLGNGLRSTPRLNDSSSSLLMNGVSPLASFMVDDLAKGGSSESSPIPMPPFSVSDPSYSAKIPNTEPNQIFVGQLPWNFTEENLQNVFSMYGEVVAAAIHNKGHTLDGKPVPKCGFVTFRTEQDKNYALKAGPISFGGHSLNIQAKDIKRVKMGTPNSLGVQELPLVPPSSNPLTLQAMAGNKPVATSAYGLQSLLDSSKRIIPPRTVTTSTTPTASKPKFQNLRSNVNVGAIGTLPPKVVRPIPRPGTSNVFGFSGAQAATKEDSLSSSASYKRLFEECKQKFGNDYSEAGIQKAIKEVRENNKNSLSGLALETILEQVEVQLRPQKRIPAKPSVAPWAQIGAEGASGNDWPGRGVDCISEDDCSICMERLSVNATMPLQCGHVFHIKCIKHWLSKKSDCPICRKFALNSDDFPSLSTH